MPADTSTNLALPNIAAAQAQKHVTHNEALRALDAIVQLAVLDQHLAAPPPSPASGDRYIVAAAATGDWVGKSKSIAAYQDGAWVFYAPLEGWIAWVADENAQYVYDGAAWQPGSLTDPTPKLGINATADTINRMPSARRQPC